MTQKNMVFHMPSLQTEIGIQNIGRELIDAIADSRYGRLLSRDRTTRLLRAAEIASLYTRQELLDEPGFDPPKVATIQRWLSRQNRRFRRQQEPVEAAVCRLDIGSSRLNISTSRVGEPHPIVPKDFHESRAEFLIGS